MSDISKDEDARKAALQEVKAKYKRFAEICASEGHKEYEGGGSCYCGMEYYRCSDWRRAKGQP